MALDEERDRVADWILGLAITDERITSGALAGSTATRSTDGWSDVDLSFACLPEVELVDVIDDWTRAIDQRLGLIHSFDLALGQLLFRVFLLASGLELDLSLAPSSAFGARGSAFRLVFGSAAELSIPEESPDQRVGLGWHHVLHAHAAIERDEPWKAEYYISALRDRTLELACLRCGLPAQYARGLDRLPASVLEASKGAMVRSLETEELRRALHTARTAYLEEVAAIDAVLAARIEHTMEIRLSG